MTHKPLNNTLLVKFMITFRIWTPTWFLRDTVFRKIYCTKDRNYSCCRTGALFSPASSVIWSGWTLLDLFWCHLITLNQWPGNEISKWAYSVDWLLLVPADICSFNSIPYGSHSSSMLIGTSHPLSDRQASIWSLDNVTVIFSNKDVMFDRRSAVST